MSDFNASDGSKVAVWPTGSLVVSHPDGKSNAITAPAVRALREYFRDERDQELGRWRSTTDPSWTAVERDNVVYFQCEDGERGFSIFRKEPRYPAWASELQSIAREYIDAHPEPKPWHDALLGEVWAVQLDFGKEAACRVTDEFKVTTPNGLSFAPITDWPVSFVGTSAPAIVSARRIWPEVTS